MDLPSPIRHMPLRYPRITAIPFFQNSITDQSQPLKLLDVSPSSLFFLYPQRPSRTIITMDIRSEIFSQPIALPITEHFEVEHFKLLDPITAVCVIVSTEDYGRRVAILRASDSNWEQITLLTLMGKEWMHKQHLDVLVHFDHPTFYLVETHHDCIPDPLDPEFSFPLHTVYRARLNGDRVDIRSLGSVTDDFPYRSPFSSLLSDSKRILMVKILFNLDSSSGNSIGSVYLNDMEDYRIQSMTLYLYTIDLESESIEKEIIDREFPPNLHICTEKTTVEMIGNQLVFSQLGGCIMYNIEDETCTKYTMPDSSREYRVESLIGGSGLLGMTDGGCVFRGYLKTVPSLHEMTHSIVQSVIPFHSSDDLSLSNTHSLIRSLFH